MEVPQCCLIHSVRRFEAKKCPSPASPATAGVVLSVSGMSFNSIFINLTTGSLGGTPVAPSLHLHIHRHGRRFHHTRHQPTSWCFPSWKTITACIHNEHILQTTTRQKKKLFFVGSFWLDIGLQFVYSCAHVFFWYSPLQQSPLG